MKENIGENQKSSGYNMHKYSIESIKVTTDGVRKLFFDVEWKGNNSPDYYELRFFDKDKNCLEALAYASQKQRVEVRDYNLNLKSGKLNAETFYAEIGIAEYSEDGELKKWEILASSKPLEVAILYKRHIFSKNEIKIIQ